LIWGREVSSGLVECLLSEGIEVVACVNGAVPGLQSYSLKEIHFGGVGFDLPVSTDWKLTGNEYRDYVRCIARIGIVPWSDEIEVHDGGLHEAGDLEDLASLQMRVVSGLLQLHQVEEVWFLVAPHLGVDIIMRAAALRKGLRVVTLRQLPYPKKFEFKVSRYEETLDLKSLTFEPWTQGAAAPDLFYMRTSSHASVSEVVAAIARSWLGSRLISGRQFVSRVWSGATRRRWLGFKTLIRISDAQTLPIACREVSARKHWKRDRLSRRMASELDFRSPFVFFGLHYQPEANHDVYGTHWGGQASAIELLAAALPEGWKIVVKENPKQLHFRRSAAFYRRMRAIPSVVWAPDDLPSGDLLRWSRIVATICGTLGLEALRIGRGCICFGDAWYGSLPGVAVWRNELNIADLSAVRYDLSALDRAMNQLMSRSADGLVVGRYAAILEEDFDHSSLIRTTARSLALIIRTADALEGQHPGFDNEF
jgi:hypothetical protein